MPVNLFSTRSSLPIPLFPAISFKIPRTWDELKSLPSRPTGSPFSKSIVISCSSSGASFNDEVLCQIDSGAGRDGSSRISPSYEVCRIFSSVE